jgi:hypothetical protein
MSLTDERRRVVDDVLREHRVLPLRALGLASGRAGTAGE